MKIALVVSLLVSTSAMAGVVRFSRRCEVVASPNPRATRLCEKAQGTVVSKFKMASGGFAQVDTTDCNGYVPTSCLEAESDTASSSRRSRGESRTPANYASETFQRVRVGPLLGGSGLFGKPQATSNSTAGYGLMAGANVILPLGRSFRFSVAPSFQILSLSRTVDGSGAIVDATPAEFQQKVTFLGASATAGYVFGGTEADGARMSFAFDGGFEFLYPLSASQTDNFGTEIKFDTKDKMLFAVVGPSGEFIIGSNLTLSAALQFFYNLGASSGNSLLGGRLALAFNIIL